MNRFAHGGDIYSRHIEHDFSSNINPLGLPDEVLLEISDSLWRCGNYPDPSCRELIRAISDSEWFPSGRIVCGNGSADPDIPHCFGIQATPRSGLRSDFQRIRKGSYGARLCDTSTLPEPGK